MALAHFANGNLGTEGTISDELEVTVRLTSSPLDLLSFAHLLLVMLLSLFLIHLLD